MNVNEQTLREKIDPYLTRQNLSAICSKALGKNVSVNAASILTGGCLNRVIGIDLGQSENPVVLKATPAKQDNGLKHEFEILQYFSEKTKMPVPSALLFDDSGHLIPGTFYVMEKIDGVVMHHMSLYENDMKSVISQLANIVTELHKYKSTGFGAAEKSPEQLCQQWSDFWLPRFDQAIDKIAAGGHITVHILDRVNKIRSGFKSLLQIGSESTLTHYDIWSGNIMITNKNGNLNISGFLDIQGYWADYGRELSFMEMFGMTNETFYQIYADIHQLDDMFHVRKDLYNLKMHLKHIHMYPDQLYYRQGAEQCLRTVENAIK